MLWSKIGKKKPVNFCVAPVEGGGGGGGGGGLARGFRNPLVWGQGQKGLGVRSKKESREVLFFQVIPTPGGPTNNWALGKRTETR